MTFSEYIDYFKTAAIHNKALAHDPASGRTAFYRLDIEELINGLRTTLRNVALILENYEVKPYDEKADNPRKMIMGAFVIIREAKKGDFDDEVLALDETEEIAEQILTKIINDNKKSRQNANYNPAIKGFDLNSWSRQKVGPIFGNCYGWRTEFTLNQTFTKNLHLDASKWNNETPFSI